VPRTLALPKPSWTVVRARLIEVAFQAAAAEIMPHCSKDQPEEAAPGSFVKLARSADIIPASAEQLRQRFSSTLQ